MSRARTRVPASRIDFLPDWYRQVRRRARTLRRQALVLIVLLGAVAAMTVWTVQQRSVLRIRHEGLVERLRISEEQAAALERLSEPYEELAASLELRQRLHRPIGYSEIAGTLISLMPRSVALTGLNLEDRQVTVQQGGATSRQGPGSARDRGGKQQGSRQPRSRPVVVVEAEGIGPTDAEVGVFADAVASSPLFEDVKIVYWRQEPYQGLDTRRFSIRMRVPLDRRYESNPRSESGASVTSTPEISHAP